MRADFGGWVAFGFWQLCLSDLASLCISLGTLMCQCQTKSQVWYFLPLLQLFHCLLCCIALTHCDLSVMILMRPSCNENLAYTCCLGLLGALFWNIKRRRRDCKR